MAPNIPFNLMANSKFDATPIVCLVMTLRVEFESYHVRSYSPSPTNNRNTRDRHVISHKNCILEQRDNRWSSSNYLKASKLDEWFKRRRNECRVNKRTCAGYSTGNFLYNVMKCLWGFGGWGSNTFEPTDMDGSDCQQLIGDVTDEWRSCNPDRIGERTIWAPDPTRRTTGQRRPPKPRNLRRQTCLSKMRQLRKVSRECSEMNGSYANWDLRH